MGESLVCGGRGGGWEGGGGRDFGYGAIVRYGKLCVYQGVCYFRQRLQEGTEYFGGVHPSHWQDHIDANDDTNVLFSQWDNVR